MLIFIKSHNNLSPNTPSSSPAYTRSTSNRRVNFEDERRLTRTTSLDVPSTSEYLKNVKKSRRTRSKPKLATHSEVIDEDEDETVPRKTKSELIDDDYDENINEINQYEDQIDEEDEDEDEILEEEEEEEERKEPARTSGRNENFEYKSFLRLRNIIFLALMLRKNPSLRKYRFHYLVEAKKREEARRSRVQSSNELFNEMFSQRLEKFKQKISWRNLSIFRGGSSSGTSSTNTNNPDDDNDNTFQARHSNNGNNERTRAADNNSNNPEPSPIIVRSSRVRTSSL